MPFAGIDIHKKIVQAEVIDDDGQVTARDRFPMTRAALERFARRHLSKLHRVALEATTNAWAAAAVLEPFVAEVVVSNPMRTKAIAEAKVKTDRVDAAVLAQLLRCDFLPRVWTPDEPTRQMRHLSTRRSSLVGDRTRIKNRIHAVLHQRMIPVPATELFSKSSLAWLQQLSLDDSGRRAIDSELRLLAALQTEVAEIDQQIRADAAADPRTRLLVTLPGVDVTVAHALLAAFGDVSRFRDADSAAAYLGLVPSTRQSGEHCYHGPITKQGRGHARWLLVQAAQHVARHPGPLGNFFRRLARRKNRNIAIVATARKLVTVAWHMLTKNEPYRYAQPHLTDGKLQRLRRAAGAARRKGGLPKGTPRPANYGSGTPTRGIKSITRVYAEQQLPALPPMRPGELAMIERAGLASFVDSVHKEHRLPRVPERRRV
jgi:transposase